MIKYHVCKDQTITSIRVSGHANYKKHGEDIVCAAVSTATILSANLLERMGFNGDYAVQVEDGFFDLKVIKSNPILEQVLINLSETLNELELQYPKYIKHQKEG
ncbi:ribosomal-processing cysteine protease Prp [Acholeplasma vituli]|uniref:Ribosomal processing cysteine protease Prp n=1 Tax=Paracholeplasma vituli TaxID=69473 RepID=A0ABT2PVR9_9MOLU|nr:ribosomal-processing cysteine protease Prp [Paracholeplasma vituli]MCU0105051.1 ribosomal-processing cysteine protease Prp [Paracholeplasma vituli]